MSSESYRAVPVFSGALDLAVNARELVKPSEVGASVEDGQVQKGEWVILLPMNSRKATGFSPPYGVVPTH